MKRGPRNCIFPIHWSRRREKGVRFKPNNMDYMRMPSQEVSDGMTNIAMSIFVDCTNAAVPFQDAITAVYLSGVDHGFHGGRRLMSDD